MIIQLLLRGQVVEQMDVDMENKNTLEARKDKVFALSQYLKYHYRQSIALSCDWDIVLIEQSKLNNNGNS